MLASAFFAEFEFDANPGRPACSAPVNDRDPSAELMLLVMPELLAAPLDAALSAAPEAFDTELTAAAALALAAAVGGGTAD